MNRTERDQSLAGRAASRVGPALLAFASRPEPAAFATVVACAANLDRDLYCATLDPAAGRPRGPIASDRAIVRAATAARWCGASVLVVEGATAAGVVRRLAALSGCPVLVARSGAEWNTILAATDLRPRRRAVIDHAAAIALGRGASWIAVHQVAPRWTPSRAEGDGEPYARRLRRLQLAAADVDPCPRAILRSASTASRGVLDAVVEHDADLLVIGARPPHGRLPGCAERILDAARCSVLVVPVPRSRRMRRPKGST